MRVALATSAEIPDGDEDFPALIAALAELGVEPSRLSGTPTWSGRASTSSSSARPGTTPSGATSSSRGRASLPRVLNPLTVLEWNTDKQRYLADLAAAGVPVVPTGFVAPGEALAAPAGPFVVKPRSRPAGAARRGSRPARTRRRARSSRRIHADGRTAMVQPYLGDVEETALVFIDGAYSHALHRAFLFRPRASARSSTWTRSFAPRGGASRSARSPRPRWPCVPANCSTAGSTSSTASCSSSRSRSRRSIWRSARAPRSALRRAIVGCLEARRPYGPASHSEDGRARHARPAATRPAHLGHRPVQLPLRLLHAEGGLRARLRVPRPARAAHVRGDRAPGPRVRRARRREDPDHRRRAARPPRPRAAGRAARGDRRPRPDADDERRAAPAKAQALCATPGCGA